MGMLISRHRNRAAEEKVAESDFASEAASEPVKKAAAPRKRAAAKKATAKPGA
ncbi:hypothetical protein ACFQ0K_07250 [Nocardioides caeni]|uniref:hypothetical protein n=1 Tax=Nocardioides caeni TaxID=574700 RepID=UPI0013052224|nr:hypothetical protein [Nocardioides caeni]